MNDKAEQALTDALIDQIESAARASFRRHQSSIKGQILTAADNYDWHLLHAAYQAGIHTMRAQLAEAQKDSDLVFLSAPPADKLLCEACERNAVLAGLPSAYELAGRHVHLGKIKAVQTCCMGEPT